LALNGLSNASDPEPHTQNGKLFMLDHKELLARCSNNSRLIVSVVDEFLVYYAAARDRLDIEFDRKMERFRHIRDDLPKGSLGLFKSQYIAHRVLRKGGLINKYLSHAKIRALEAPAQEFLHFLADNPWQFRFSILVGSPATDFHDMIDVFTGESFLLYSGNVSALQSEKNPMLWLNLVGYNGMCWQSFGPVMSFQSFDADDIAFFASENAPIMRDDDDILEDLENDPLPYLMLVNGSQMPWIFQEDQESVHVCSEVDCRDIDIKSLRKHFKVEYAENVFRITHKKWSGPFDFGEAYFDELKGVFFLTAMTERGYTAMQALFMKHGIELPDEPEVRVHPAMLALTEKLLKRHLQLNPYSELFEEEEDDPEMLAPMNNFMELLIGHVNQGKKPDIDLLAKEAGIDPGQARELYASVLEKIKEMEDKYGSGKA
jgi:hypothetical protein